MSLQKSLGWMGMAQVASIVLQFGASVILARLMGPHEFGVFAVAMAVAGVLSLIQALGLQALIVREPELSDEVSTTAFTVNAVIAVVLVIAMTLASLLGGFLLKEDGVRRVLLAVAATPLLGVVAFLPAAQLERRGRFKELALAGVIAGAASALTTVVFAARGASYMSFAYGQWAQGLVFAIVICLYGQAFVKFKVGFSAWRRVADFGFQMFAVAGVNAISGRLSDLVMGRLIGLSALGLYSRATNLNNIIWNNIHLVLGRVLLVDFAEILRRGDTLRERYVRTVDIITAILWPAFLGLAVVARPLIATLYGEKWIAAATPLVFLAIASVIQVGITMTWELFASTGNLRTQTKVEIVRSVIGLAMFAGACFISLEAAAFSRVLDAVVAYALYRPHVNRMTHTRTRDFIPIYLRNMVLALATITPCLVLMALHGFAPSTPIGLVLVAVVCGGLLWLVGLVMIRHPLIEEAQRIFKIRQPDAIGGSR